MWNVFLSTVDRNFCPTHSLSHSVRKGHRGKIRLLNLILQDYLDRGTKFLETSMDDVHGTFGEACLQKLMTTLYACDYDGELYLY